MLAWLARYSSPALRISLGIVFFRFGALKFFPATLRGGQALPPAQPSYEAPVSGGERDGARTPQT